MTSDEILDNVNTAALVLGYPTLVIFVATLFWFAGVVAREVFRIVRASKFERWRQNREIREVENLEASWDLTSEPQVRNTPHDTDILEFPIPGLSTETVYDHTKEQL